MKKKENQVTSLKPGSKFTWFSESTKTIGAAMASFKLIPNHKWFIIDCNEQKKACYNKELHNLELKLQSLSYQGHGCGNHASSWSTNRKNPSRLWLQYRWSHGGWRPFTYRGKTKVMHCATEIISCDSEIKTFYWKVKRKFVTLPACNVVVLLQKSASSLFRIIPVRGE